MSTPAPHPSESAICAVCRRPIVWSPVLGVWMEEGRGDLGCHSEPEGVPTIGEHRPELAP